MLHFARTSQNLRDTMSGALLETLAAQTDRLRTPRLQGQTVSV